MIGGASSCWMWVGCNLHRGHTHGRRVSGFLVVGVSGSSSAALVPSPLANTEAVLSILMPPDHWLTAIHGCVAYGGHVSTLSLWCLSWRAPSLMINWTGNSSECSVAPTWFSWVFFTWKPDSGRGGRSVLIFCPSMKPRCTPRPGSWEALPLLWFRCIFLVCLS